MKRVRHLFNRIIRLCWVQRQSKPQDIPRKLSATSLAAAMKEAEYLRASFAVDIQEPTPDELPISRRAD